jgi:hypothetical protein
MASSTPRRPFSSEDDETFTSAIFVQRHLSSDGAFYFNFDVRSQISGHELDFVDHNCP